jgi:hypothetical protein
MAGRLRKLRLAFVPAISENDDEETSIRITQLPWSTMALSAMLSLK